MGHVVPEDRRPIGFYRGGQTTAPSITRGGRNEEPGKRTREGRVMREGEGETRFCPALKRVWRENVPFGETQDFKERGLRHQRESSTGEERNRATTKTKIRALLSRVARATQSEHTYTWKYHYCCLAGSGERALRPLLATDTKDKAVRSYPTSHLIVLTLPEGLNDHLKACQRAPTLVGEDSGPKDGPTTVTAPRPSLLLPFKGVPHLLSFL